MAASFSSNILLVWFLSPAAFGLFATLNAIVGLAGSVVNFRTPEVVLRTSEDELDSRFLASIGSAICLEGILIAGVVLVVLSAWNLNHVGAFILLGTTITTTWLRTEVRLYERTFDYGTISKMEVVPHVVAHATVVGGAAMGGGELMLYLRGAIRAGGIFLVLWYIGSIGSFPVRWIGRQEWKTLLSRISGIWGDGLLEQSFRRAAMLVVSSLAGESVTGLFYQARKLSMIPVRLVTSIVDRLGLNYFSRQGEADRMRALRRALLVVASLLGLTAIAAWQLGPLVIPVVLGEEWTGVAPLLALMSGIIIGFPLLSLVKVYYMAGEEMGRFILLGRSIQYIAAFAVVGAALLMGVRPEYGLSVALSAGYLSGLVCSYLAIR